MYDNQVLNNSLVKLCYLTTRYSAPILSVHTES